MSEDDKSGIGARHDRSAGKLGRFLCLILHLWYKIITFVVIL